MSTILQQKKNGDTKVMFEFYTIIGKISISKDNHEVAATVNRPSHFSFVGYLDQISVSTFHREKKNSVINK